MFGSLFRFLFYLILTAYALGTFGYLVAISESLALERTDGVPLPSPIGQEG